MKCPPRTLRFLVIFLFLSNCLAVDNTKAKKKSVIFIRLNGLAENFSSKPETYSIDNSNNPIIGGNSSIENPTDSIKTPNYQVTNKEVLAISEYEATLKEMNWLDEKIISESIQNFNNTFYYQKRTDDEIEADVLDWDLGLPAENRKLEGSARETKKSENIAELKKFFTTIQSQIVTITDEDLRTLRINSLIGINSYEILKPHIEKNPDIEKSIFEMAIKGHVQTRELVINEMLKRGIDL